MTVDFTLNKIYVDFCFGDFTPFMFAFKMAKFSLRSMYYMSGCTYNIIRERGRGRRGEREREGDPPRGRERGRRILFKLGLSFREVLRGTLRNLKSMIFIL